jgi:hypothetical protein
VKYVLTCPRDEEVCYDVRENVDSFGWTVFAILMTIYLGQDILNGFRLVEMGAIVKSERLIFCGSFLIVLLVLDIWTSTIYSKATATAMTNADLIMNAVILLFINEIDERAYCMLKSTFTKWTQYLEDDADNAASTFSKDWGAGAMNQEAGETQQQDESECFPGGEAYIANGTTIVTRSSMLGTALPYLSDSIEVVHQKHGLPQARIDTSICCSGGN